MIRRAELGDLDQLVEVHLAAFRAGNGPFVDAASLNELTPENDAEAWRPVIERPPPAAELNVAERHGRIVGLCGAGPSRDADGAGVGELYAIYVDPRCWGDGTASALEAAARRHLAACGFTEATLWTVAANARARRFYERRGWRADGAMKELMGAAAVRYRTSLREPR